MSWNTVAQLAKRLWTDPGLKNAASHFVKCCFNHCGIYGPGKDSTCIHEPQTLMRNSS